MFKRSFLCLLFLGLIFQGLFIGTVKSKSSWNEMLVILKKMKNEGKLLEPNNVIGTFNYIAKEIEGLGNKEGFTKLSLLIVPLCMVASLFLSSDKINKLLNSSTNNASDYIYNLSSAIGKVKGSYDYGERDGYNQILMRHTRRHRR